MTLDEANSGETVRVLVMPRGMVRTQMLRLGVEEGSELRCILRIPAGPVVVRHGTLEMALGRKIASAIEVRSCHASPRGDGSD